MTAAFSRSQLVTLALAFGLVVAIVGSSAWWVKSPSYALLFSDMDADTAGQVVTKLKTMKVPYQLDPGGKGIRVPEDRVDEIDLSGGEMAFAHGQEVASHGSVRHLQRSRCIARASAKDITEEAIP